MGKNFDPGRKCSRRSKESRQECLNPIDITKMVLWLAESDEATKFTGREVVIDMGAML